MSHTIRFTKMHGAGNDYIYVFVPKNPITEPEKASILWSRYHYGIGSDGLILIDNSEKSGTDFSMRIFNNDGSEAMMCGNGIRCVGKYLYDNRITNKTQLAIDTRSGIKMLNLHVENGRVSTVTVDMGEPVLKDKKLLNTPDGGLIAGRVGDCIGTFVSMGNPHFVIFVDDVMSLNLSEVGETLEHNPIFPERCNIEFATIHPDGIIRMRVWERGSGITMACGTGACATAVAASVNGLASRNTIIEMDGGKLSIQWKEDNHIYMTGAAEKVFEGRIELNE